MTESHYIFLTDKGLTFEPFSNSCLPDVENPQVLGIASGKTQEEAFQNLLKKSSCLENSEFGKVVGYKLDDAYAENIKLHHIDRPK